MPRFAANLTLMYTEHAFLDRFAAAKNDGFAAAEFMFPYAQPAEAIRTRLDDLGLSQVLFNAPPGDWEKGERGITCIPGREDEFRAGVGRALEYAKALKCPRVHTMAGLMPAGSDRAKLRETYVGNVAWAADQAATAGVDLIIEPIARTNMPGFFLNRQDEAHAIVAELGKPNLKVMMDLFHVQVEEGNLTRRIRKYVGEQPSRVGHMQIAGVPDRHEPDTGEVNYSYVFDVIDAAGYTGWIGLEYIPLKGTSEGLRWLRDRAQG